MSGGTNESLAELQALQERIGRAEAAPEPAGGEMARLVEWLRWSSREIRGGMDNYIRVRAMAQSDAYGRVAGELERAADEGKAAVLTLAACLRARSLSGEVPTDVELPTLWRPDRPVPELEPARARREQQIGFCLGLARAAAQIHVAAGGRV